MSSHLFSLHVAFKSVVCGNLAYTTDTRGVISLARNQKAIQSINRFIDPSTLLSARVEGNDNLAASNQLMSSRLIYECNYS